MTDPGQLLGRQDDRPALLLSGRTVGYPELAELAAAIPVEPILTPASDDPVQLLTCVLAAARTGAAVVIADPHSPAPPIASPPAGTFLAVVTSGSTGRPRVVLRTVDSWTASFAPFAQVTGITADDTVLLTGPLHSTLQLFAAVHTLWLGGTVTDDPALATVAHGVPAVLAGLAAPRLRLAVSAGSALPTVVAADLTRRGIEILEYYGAAELSFVAVRRPPQAFRPFPGVELRSVDGVLWARSRYLATGYLDGPLTIDRDGFATAGDLGELAADGSLTVFGRGDAAVTVGGQTVLAEDVEAAVATVPGVRAVAAVGLPHRRFGQLLTAVLELDDGAELAQVRAACRRLLRGEALPRRWVVLPALPRTAGGKIARAAVLTALTQLSEPLP